MINAQLNNILNSTRLITLDDLETFKNKNYASGRPIQVGDKLLLGLINDGLKDENSKKPELKIKLITFHIEELGVLYKIDERDNRENELVIMLKLI